jgi:hypothetical protein
VNLKGHWLVLALLSALAPAALGAQERQVPPVVETVVRGVVWDPGHRPARGAEVTLAGQRVSVRTDDTGSFVLRIPADAGAAGVAVLRVQAEGFRVGELRVMIEPGVVRGEVVLAALAVPLAPVTSTGGAAQRSRTTAPGRLDAVEVAAGASARTMSELLQARIPGLSISHASGTPGTAAQFRIRGVHSLGAGEPAVFVDGIRVDARARELLDVGGQMTSALTGIAPEEIESVEVLRGPASTLWYGPDAAAGAIHVTTRQGDAGVGVLRQRMAIEYGVAQPNVAFPDNWARCADWPGGACEGQPPEILFRDNPLRSALGSEKGSSLHWSGLGGVGDVAYFGAFGWTQEAGVLPGSDLDRRSGRLNLRFAPGAGFEVGVGYGGGRTVTRLPYEGGYGFSLLRIALGGNTLTGWPSQDWQLAAATPNEVIATRSQPTVQLIHHTFPWLTQQVRAGADLTRQEGGRTLPSDFGDGARLQEHVEQKADLRTYSYLARVHRTLGAEGGHSTALKLGVQVQKEKEKEERETVLLRWPGTGMDTAAAEWRKQNQTRDLTGFVVQGEYGYRDRLFLEAGARLDRVDGWGGKLNSLFSPRVGISYLLSEAAFWEPVRPVVGTLRLRGAWGRAEADLSDPKFAPSFGAGVPIGLPVPPVPKLRPQRHSELELGIDAGMLNDRVGVEWTIFRGEGKDLWFVGPLPSYSGYQGIGPLQGASLRNQGMELALDARLVSRRALAWEARLALSRLQNEVMGSGGPAGWYLSADREQLVPGTPVGGMFTRRILSVDVANNWAIVSDTSEIVGNSLPGWEGSIASNVTLGGRVRLAGLLDWRAGYQVYNQTEERRDRFYRSSERWAQRDDLPASERLRYLGPYYDSNGLVGSAYVRDPYLQNGRFLRLRELSLSYDLPGAWAGRIGARGAALTLAGRNLALWSAYGGADPEVLASATALSRQDHFTLPPVARWSGRVTVQF